MHGYRVLFDQVFPRTCRVRRCCLSRERMRELRVEWSGRARGKCYCGEYINKVETSKKTMKIGVIQTVGLSTSHRIFRHNNRLLFVRLPQTQTLFYKQKTLSMSYKLKLLEKPIL